MNLPSLVATHQYQYDGSHRNRNECGSCAMAMLLTQAARSAGRADFWLPAYILGQYLDRIPFRYPRFPAWFPRTGGATHPLAALWGMRDYIHQLQSWRVSFPWQPVLRTRQTTSDLQEALVAGQPTLIYGVGLNGVPHVVVPIAHSDYGWQILDPGLPRERSPVHWSDSQLQNWWVNYSVLYPRGTMISLIPEQAA